MLEGIAGPQLVREIISEGRQLPGHRTPTDSDRLFTPSGLRLPAIV